jgi:hypothetical protein
MPPLVTYHLHFDENEIYATSEVIIIILDPSLDQNKIKTDALIRADKCDNANGSCSRFITT